MSLGRGGTGRNGGRGDRPPQEARTSWSPRAGGTGSALAYTEQSPSPVLGRSGSCTMLERKVKYHFLQKSSPKGTTSALGEAPPRDLLLSARCVRVLRAALSLPARCHPAQVPSRNWRGPRGVRVTHGGNSAQWKWPGYRCWRPDCV